MASLPSQNLTQQSGPLTCLVSDLGQACKKYNSTVEFLRGLCQVVIQDARARHALMHSDLLGFLYCLLHEETLLPSGVSREDGELVELNVVLEGQPRLHVKALV